MIVPVCCAKYRRVHEITIGKTDRGGSDLLFNHRAGNCVF